MHFKFKNLLEISAKLRGEGGCPWDRKQTLQSMRPMVLEEAQEVVEALDKDDMENLEEEIGDLLFCLIMMAQIAHEDKKFNMGTVLEKITEKIISRHTWVFGSDKAETAEEALALWKKNKETARAKNKPTKNKKK